MSIKTKVINLLLFSLSITLFACGGGGGNTEGGNPDGGVVGGGGGGGGITVNELANTMVGSNTYAVTNGSAVVKFDGALTATVFQSNYIGSAVGTYSVVNNVITITVPGEVFELTIVGGDKETINAQVKIGGVAQNDAVFQRIASIINGANAIDKINITNLTGKFYVDHAAIETVLLPSICDGVMNDGVKLFKATAAFSLFCKIHPSGLLEVVNETGLRTLYGVLATDWDGSNLNQAFTVLEYEIINNDSDAVLIPNNVATALDLATEGPVNIPVGMNIDSNNRLTLRFTTAGTGTTIAPVMADFYRVDSNVIPSALSQFRRRIVLGQVNLVTGSTPISYSTKNSDDTKIRYRLNLGTRNGVSIDAILKTNNNLNATNLSLMNPLSAINSRTIYGLAPISLLQILAGATTATYDTVELTDAAVTSIIAFNNDLTGVLTLNNVNTAFTWAENAAVTGAKLAGKNFSPRSYPATIVLTLTDGTIMNLYAQDNGAGVFTMGVLIVDSVGTLVRVSGVTATRR